MRIAAGLSLFFLLGGISAAAQARSAATSPPQLPACPVDMSVHQGIGGGMLAVDKDGVERRVFAPRLRLFLNDLRPDRSAHKIVSAKVQVLGSSGKAGILPLNAEPAKNDGQNSGSLERTITVDLANWGEPGVSGDFRMPGFVSASRIDLLSITYQDGSTWSVSAPDSCRVAPDPLMLIIR